MLTGGEQVIAGQYNNASTYQVYSSPAVQQSNPAMQHNNPAMQQSLNSVGSITETIKADRSIRMWKMEALKVWCNWSYMFMSHGLKNSQYTYPGAFSCRRCSTVMVIWKNPLKKWWSYMHQSDTIILIVLANVQFAQS